MDNCWLYEGKKFDESDIPDGVVGFVYLITDLHNNKKYVGKKNFFTVKKMPPLKGRKNKRHVKKQSDWKNYYGSNAVLQELVETHNRKGFKREILWLCESKGMMSYLEMKEQIERRVLFDDSYYNNFIGGKIHQKHVNKMET